MFVVGFVCLIFGRHYEVNHFYLHYGVYIIYLHSMSNPQFMACNHCAICLYYIAFRLGSIFYVDDHVICEDKLFDSLCLSLSLPSLPPYPPHLIALVMASSVMLSRSGEIRNSYLVPTIRK